MNPEIIIKEVIIEEAIKVNNTIVEFEKRNGGKDYFKERYKDKEKLIVVAYLNEQPVGYIVSYDLGDNIFYCWLAGVSPEFRRKGILTALMDYQENWAKRKDYKKIKIKTRNNMKNMLTYLVKSGFYFIEVVQQPEIEENRILLEKDI